MAVQLSQTADPKDYIYSVAWFDCDSHSEVILNYMNFVNIIRNLNSRLVDD